MYTGRSRRVSLRDGRVPGGIVRGSRRDIRQTVNDNDNDVAERGEARFSSHNEGFFRASLARWSIESRRRVRRIDFARKPFQIRLSTRACIRGETTVRVLSSSS